MRKIVVVLISTFPLLGLTHNTTIKKYTLIQTVAKQLPGFEKKVKITKINKPDIDRLSDPLKALAAYYSALAGNNCDKGDCELTSALGLGAQGSDDHKMILKKWFPSDSIAKALIAQNCFQSSNGSSYFTNYSSLVFEINKDAIDIRFTILKYDHGKTFLQKSHENAIIKSDETIIITRKLKG